MSEEDVSFWRAIYDEKINRADVEFYTFLDQVQNMNLLENTIIIVMSDHGTEFYEHQNFDHGATLYSELVNVLFAIHQPGQSKGQKIDQLVSTLDILPTTLKMLGIKNPVPQQVKGVDLTPALSGKTVAHNVFSETDYRLYTFKRSLQTPDGWKFILTLENGNKELYNLKQDPQELTNLITQNPVKGYEIEQVLRQHLDEISGLRSSSQLGCSPVYGDQCQK
jgi:arylsulfatase A-like enzyme